MTFLAPGSAEAPAQAAPLLDRGAARALYQAAWRWHFYAGLFVAPFLVMLALTGLLMLWASATTDLNGERMTVPVTGEPAPVSALIAAAEGAVPGGTALRYVEPRGPGQVALVQVAAPDGGEIAVLVDPYRAAAIDHFAWDSGLYALASDIHGTLLMGDWGDRLIEIASGFGVVLIVTGLVLWWPRSWGRGAVLLPSLRAGGRAFWLRLHASLGFWTLGLLLVFLLSGLSWTGIWGGRFVQAWNSFPAEKWDAPLSETTHAALDGHAEHGVPWALEQTALPESGSPAGLPALVPPVTIDAVAAFARDLGLPGRFQIHLPQGETGVWTISHDSMSHDGPDPTADRTIHIDRYSGHLLADVRFADYSPYAKAMAVGIAFHEGRIGVWNLVLNTVFCLAVIGLAVSGLVMWWRRRPARVWRLGAPPMPERLPGWRVALLAAILLGLAFPLTGAAMLGVLALDVLILRHLGALRHVLN